MNFANFVQTWAMSTPSLVFGPEGRVTIARYYDDGAATELMRRDFAKVTDFRRPKIARAQRFTNRVKLNPSNADRFNVDLDDILATTNLAGKPIEKFSWNPVTGELLLIHPLSNHASQKGASPFDDYVRGIILHKQNKVLFRPFWPTWVKKTPYDRFDEEAAAISFDAQWQAKEMIERHGGRGWNIEMNTNNRQLQEMTGRRNW
jgi:hypothetical protein